MTPENNIPTVLVALGGTGDLMRRKVLPALFYLFKHKELPDMFRVVGFSHRDYTNEDFRKHVREVVEKHAGQSIPDEELEPFLKLFWFHKGSFDDPTSYEVLREKVAEYDAEWGVCANKLFYLAVAPEYYDVIFRSLASSGLTTPCSPKEGWTRVIVEKPFGMSIPSARALERTLGRLFKSEQVYRIDHYLGKEMLQNILTFRFANNLFELQWGKELIESVHIRSLEKIGVEGRGHFYDPVGAFIDVGQNHFLAMLSLVAMARPKDFGAKAVHQKRAEILKKLRILSPADVKKYTVRGQYKGYRDIENVAKSSKTETYFKVRAELADTRWRDVPFYLEGGKRLGEPQKEIVITFKHPKPCFCPPGQPHHKNQVVIRYEPKEEILIEFWSKTPGFAVGTKRHEFHFLFREPSAHVPYIEEYAKLLMDCVRGDRTLFISAEEIKAMWRFTDPIVAAWRKGAVPLTEYEPDTKEIVEKARSIETDAITKKRR